MRARLTCGLAMASLAVLSPAGCSDTSGALPAPVRADTPGSIGLALTLAPGSEAAWVDYAISGNGFPKTGSIPVLDSTTIAAQIGGIPPGAGYLLALSIRTIDGKISCSGTSTFDIAAGATTTLHVAMRCTLPDPNGAVVVVGTTNMCPVVDELMVVPAGTVVGGSVALTAAAHDPDGTPVTYAWTTTAGRIADPQAPVTELRCTTQAQAAVTLTVTDNRCPVRTTLQVECACTAPTDCPGQDNACGHRLCTAGVCGMWFEPAGTTPAGQTAGDCHTLRCDGTGAVLNMVDDTDLPIDYSECTDNVCTNGTPSNPFSPFGTPCTQNDGQICDGQGTCDTVRLRVVRVGNGLTGLSTAASSAHVLEFYDDGSMIGGPIDLPTVASPGVAPLTLSGAGSTEGGLALSADGRFNILAGYAAAPGTLSVSGSYTPTVNRVVGRIDANRNVDTSTRLNTAFSYGAVRAATSLDGSGFWVTGQGSPLGGVWYVPIGATGGQLLNSGVIRSVQIADGQLYASTAGVSTVGNGLPIVAGQTLTSLPGLPTTGTSSAAAFALIEQNPAVAGRDTLYIADDRSASSGGGVCKWTYDGATWSLVHVFQLPGNTVGFRGLGAIATGQGVLVLATTADAVSNRLVRLLDDGTPNPTMSVVYTATANTVLRGVAIAPRWW